MGGARLGAGRLSGRPHALPSCRPRELMTATPMFPLGMTLLPGELLPLRIFEPALPTAGHRLPGAGRERGRRLRHRAHRPGERGRRRRPAPRRRRPRHASCASRTPATGRCRRSPSAVSGSASSTGCATTRTPAPSSRRGRRTTPGAAQIAYRLAARVSRRAAGPLRPAERRHHRRAVDVVARDDRHVGADDTIRRGGTGDEPGDVRPP